jgi:phosphoglycerate dehydrogenase-like enzyme
VKICLTADLAGHVASGLADVGAEIELVRLGLDGKLDKDADGVEVVAFSSAVVDNPPMLAAIGRFIREPALRWVQSPGAGVDNPAFKILLDRGVHLTNGSGLHAEPIAQYIFTYVLHWERRVPRHQAQQAGRQWQRIYSGDLTGKTLGIVGLGGIGRAAARVAKAFGMRVLGTRRTPVDDPNVDRFLPRQQLHELLAESHYVVLCVPFTDETRHLIGPAELGAMRKDAVLINVARGGVVDEPALIDALRAGRIRGASLDVTTEEPLPADSPLWSLENCVLTPHDAGYSPLANQRLAALFLENLGRWLRGEALRNEVTDVGLGGR